MRKPIIAGNWKMYKTVAESVSFVRELAPRLAGISGVELVVCPTFVALASVAEALRGTNIHVGAQSVHWKLRARLPRRLPPPCFKG